MHRTKTAKTDRDDELGFFDSGHVGFVDEGRRFRSARRRARQAISPYWQAGAMREYAGWKLSGAMTLDDLAGIRRQKIAVLDARLVAAANAASVAALENMISLLSNLSAQTLDHRVKSLIARGQQVIDEFGSELARREPGPPRDLVLEADRGDEIDEPQPDLDQAATPSTSVAT